MLLKQAIARTANLALVKGCIGDFGNFSTFSLKTQFCPACHIGADFSDWTVPTLWNSLKEKVWKCGQFCNLFCKGSDGFDRPDYWMSTICPTKLLKTAFFPRYVSLLKKHRLTGLHVTRVVSKILKSKLVEHKKIRFEFSFWPPF